MADPLGNATTSALDLFPSLDRLDFSKSCDAYGRWFGSVLAVDPWMPNTSYMGSISLSIDLLTTALPTGFNDTPEGAWFNDAPESLIWGNMLEWWTEQLYGNVTVIDGESYLLATDAILQRAILDPKEKCPKEFCKAYALKGNGDTAGIGVSRRSRGLRAAARRLTAAARSSFRTTRKPPSRHCT